jgi:hypothetical protein
MSRISLASRLAISFIRPFRSYLDGYMLIKDSKPKLEEDLKDRIESIASSAKKMNPGMDGNRIDYAKDCMFAINMQLLANYDKSYEKVLPDVINNLTISLEKEMISSFSEQEIERLTDMLSDPLMKKLLSNKNIFGLLKKCELDMDYRLRMKTLESVISTNNIEKIRETFTNLKKKWGLEETENIEEDEGWSENDEDVA